VQEDDRLADAPCPRGVIIEARAIEIDELTPHDVGGESGAGCGVGWRSCAKMPSLYIRDKRQQMQRGLTT